MRRAGAITEAAFADMLARLRHGMTELEIIAEVDYQFKKQAKQFWSILADVQEIRQGVREGRHKSAP